MSGHSNKSVANFYVYFRQLVASHLDEEDTKIGGPGVIIEIDESKFGKRKYHRGHHVEGVWIVGGVERTEERKAFAVPVQNRTNETLLAVLAEHVLPGSIVLTDGWAGYREVTRILGLEHRTVNHSENFVDPVTGTHTNTIEGTWNGIKQNIAPRNRTESNVSGHLFEFMWRRKHAATLWDSLVTAMKEVSFDE